MARAETRTGGRPETSGVIPGDYALSVGLPDKPAPKGWIWTKLTDVSRLESGHTPSRKHPEYWGGDVPWVGIKDATSNHGSVLFETNQQTNDLGIANSSARILPKNTVCLSRTASVGYVVVMGKPMATSQDFVNWVCEPSKLDFRYLKYVLLSESRSYARFSTGTTHQTIYFPEVKAFHICLPTLQEQSAIADVLNTLDDKIELNRQMNETLEAMAQALFKSWFVDFDPVIDNALAAGNEIPEPLQTRAAARRALGEQRRSLPADIQSLFPDNFVFTDEMGWMPDGWSATLVSSISKVIKGKSYKSSELEESSSALVTLKSFNRGGGYRLDGLKEYTGSYKPEQEVFAGDLVIAYTDVTQAADVIGKPAMVVSDERYEHLVISLDVAVVRPEKQEYRSFLYGLAKTEHFQQHTKAHSTGTTVLHLSKDAVPGYLFSCPSEELVKAYDEKASPLFKAIDLNISRNRTLEKLRDTLLPKLLSGELRVSVSDEDSNLIELKTLDEFVDYFVAEKTVVHESKQDTNMLMFKMVLESDKNTTTYYSFKLKHLRDKLTSVFNIKNAGLMTAFTTALNIEVNSQEIYNFVMSSQSQFSTAILALLIGSSSSIRDFFKTELVSCNAIAIITALHQNNGALHEDRLYAISNQKLTENKLPIMNHDQYLTVLLKLESCGLLKSTNNRTWFLQDEVKYVVK